MTSTAPAPRDGAAPLIAATGLHVALGGRTTLTDVSAAVDRGEIVTIIGPNGAGKSTLVRAMLGLVRPDAGVVRRAPGLAVGYAPQTLALDPTMPMTAGRFLDLPTRRDPARRSAALARVGAAGLERRAMTSLSGGQFQRVLLARALVGGPDLLILDEPTQGLDQQGAVAFYRLIDEIRRESGCGVLMISHDVNVVMAASDRVVCLSAGAVCCAGAPSQVAGAPAYRTLFGDGALALYRHAREPRRSGGAAQPGPQ